MCQCTVLKKHIAFAKTPCLLILLSLPQLKEIKTREGKQNISSQNYQIVNNDVSKSIHCLTYSVGFFFSYMRCIDRNFVYLLIAFNVFSSSEVKHKDNSFTMQQAFR